MHSTIKNYIFVFYIFDKKQIIECQTKTYFVVNIVFFQTNKKNENIDFKFGLYMISYDRRN